MVVNTDPSSQFVVPGDPGDRKAPQGELLVRDVDRARRAVNASLEIDPSQQILDKKIATNLWSDEDRMTAATAARAELDRTVTAESTVAGPEGYTRPDDIFRVGALIVFARKAVNQAPFAPPHAYADAAQSSDYELVA